MLAMMVGVMMMGAGFFRAGWVANLLSIPVLTGFLAGIAVHIVISQAPSFLGLPSGSGSFFNRVAQIFQHMDQFRPAALLLGLACLATIVAAERLSPRIPGALLALVGATAAALFLGLESQGLPVIGAFDVAPPHPAIPLIDPEDFVKVFGLAVIITLVVMVQSAATSRSFPGLPGEAPDINRDFIGIGLGGLLSGLFGGFPVNASPPRSALVAESGGRSQLAGLAAAAAIVMVAAFGEGFLKHTPEAALAAILFFVAGRIFRIGDMRDIAARSRPEFILVLVTLLAVVFLPVQTGVALAIMLSLHSWRLDHHPDRCAGFRTPAGRNRVVAAQSHQEGRSAEGCEGDRLSGAAVLCQRRPFPARIAPRRGYAGFEADRAGGEQHRRHRLYGGQGPRRRHRRLP